MKNMLGKVWEESRKEDKYDDLEHCIAENCLTYEDLGVLFVQLLSYHSGWYDDKAIALLVDMMAEYIDENV